MMLRSRIARTLLLLAPTSPVVTYALGEPLIRLLQGRAATRRLDIGMVRRVLVVRPDEIGDMVLSSPFLRELRRLFPGAHITLVVKSAVRDLIEMCPYVDEVLTCDWSADRPNSPRRRRDSLLLAYRFLWRHYWRALRMAQRELWSRHVDLAIVPRWDTDYYHGAYVAYFSGASFRVGYTEGVNPTKRVLNAGVDRLFTHVLHDVEPRHEVVHNLDIVRALGGTVGDEGLEVWTSAEDDAHAGAFLDAHAVGPDDALVALAPGARDARRMWPLARFAEVAAGLVEAYGARVVVVGGPGDAMLGQELRRRLGESVLDATGRMTLRQTTALLRRCRLYVGNDTGLMHLAAAVGIPVVEISCHPHTGGPAHANAPVRFGPWGVPHAVLRPAAPQPPGQSCLDGCSAHTPHCILGVTPQQVGVAAAALLSRGEWRAREEKGDDRAG